MSEKVSQYVRPWQMDKLYKLGYLTDEEYKQYEDVGLVTVIADDGTEIGFCPDMWMAPETITPIIELLGNRTGSGQLHEGAHQ